MGILADPPTCLGRGPLVQHRPGAGSPSRAGSRFGSHMFARDGAGSARAKPARPAGHRAAGRAPELYAGPEAQPACHSPDSRPRPLGLDDKPPLAAHHHGGEDRKAVQARSLKAERHYGVDPPGACSADGRHPQAMRGQGAVLHDEERLSVDRRMPATRASAVLEPWCTRLVALRAAREPRPRADQAPCLDISPGGHTNTA
jgi:hypothetical protein